MISASTTTLLAASWPWLSFFSNPRVRQISQDVDITNGNEPFSNHAFQRGQQRLDPFREVHDVDANRQVLAQFQEAGRVQLVTGPVAFDAAGHAGARDALLLTHLDDGRVQRPPAPLIGAVYVDHHQLGINFDFHGTTYLLENTRPTSVTPRSTPTNPAKTLPQTLANAYHQLPSRTSLKVSHSKVEKVV